MKATQAQLFWKEIRVNLDPINFQWFIDNIQKFEEPTVINELTKVGKDEQRKTIHLLHRLVQAAKGKHKREILEILTNFVERVWHNIQYR